MRPEKANIVADLSERLTRSPFILVTDYQRMNVNHFADLRNRLAASGAEMHVVKNSFLKRAMSDSGLPDVAESLTGQTAVVTGEKDVAPIAKVLKTFAAEFKIAALKIGVVDRSILSNKDLETLAELPPREILLAQLLGLMMSAPTKLVRLLNEPGAALARLLNARKEKLPAESPKASAEPAAKASSSPDAPAKPEVKAEVPAEAAPEAAPTPAAETAPAPPAEASAASEPSPAPTEGGSSEAQPEGGTTT